MMKKYYLVSAKCGHVGKGNYIEVVFPIYAESAHDAAQLALKKPKVKKHLKDAITNVIEVDYDEFKTQLIIFNNNKYVRSHTKREVLDFTDYVMQLDHKKRHYKTSFALQTH